MTSVFQGPTPFGQSCPTKPPVFQHFYGGRASYERSCFRATTTQTVGIKRLAKRTSQIGDSRLDEHYFHPIDRTVAFPNIKPPVLRHPNARRLPETKSHSRPDRIPRTFCNSWRGSIIDNRGPRRKGRARSHVTNSRPRPRQIVRQPRRPSLTALPMARKRPRPVLFLYLHISLIARESLTLVVP